MRIAHSLLEILALLLCHVHGLIIRPPPLCALYPQRTLALPPSLFSFSLKLKTKLSVSLSLSLFFIFDGESCGSVGVYSVPHGGGWLRRSREFIFEAHTPILRRGQGAVAIEEFEFECERGREMVAEEE